MSDVLEPTVPGTPEGTTPEPVVTEPAVTEPVIEPVQAEPQKIVVEGLGEFTPDQIKEFKQGYMRQSDYTRKTQEVANQRKEATQAMELYNYLKANPHVAQALAQVKPGTAVPTQDDRLAPLEQEVASLKLDKTLSDLQSKYADFDEVEVLNYSVENGEPDLEKVYKILKADKTPDPKQIEAELRTKIEKEILEKIKANGVNTTTIVGNNDLGQPVGNSLTQAEMIMASKLGLSPEEYAKWK